MINDADPRIIAFWSAVLDQTDRFLRLLRDTTLDVATWRRQRHVYQHPQKYSPLRVGFAVREYS